MLDPATHHLTFVEFRAGAGAGQTNPGSRLDQPAKEMAHVARFAAVDCGSPGLKALCEQYGVAASPSNHEKTEVGVFGRQPGQDQTEMLSKLDMSRTGSNTIQSQISDLVKTRAPVIHLTSDAEITRFLAAKLMNRVLLLITADPKHHALTTFEALAIDFKSDETMFAVATADSGVADKVLEKLNIDKLAAMPSQPASSAAVLVLPSHGRRPHVYKKKVGAQQRAQLTTFLNKFLDWTDPLDPAQAPQPAKQAPPTQQQQQQPLTDTTAASLEPRTKRVVTKSELQDICFQTHSSPCLIASIAARKMLDGLLMIKNVVEDDSVKQGGYVQAVYLVDLTDDAKDLARWLGLSPYGEMNPKEQAAVQQGEPIAWYHPTGVAYVNGAEGWQVNLREGATLDTVREMVKRSQRGLNKESRVQVSKHLARFVADEL